MFVYKNCGENEPLSSFDMVIWGVDLPVDDFGHEIFDFNMAIGDIPDI